MRIISFRKLREFSEKDPNSRIAMQDWYKRVSKADWEDFSDHSYQPKKHFSEELLDLILYEIDANEMRTGLSLIRKIRLQYPHTPIIAHTSCYITPHDVEKCYKSDCNELIYNLFSAHELANTLMKYMEE